MNMAIPESTGTTIIGLKYKDGIIFGADSRTSMGTYISNRITNKITPINNHILCCRCGNAASTQVISHYVKVEMERIASTEDRLPDVRDAANMAKNIIYRYQWLTAAMIIGGYDNNGPDLYSVSLCGSMIKENIVINGSGSAFIYGWCDENYKPDMNRDEAYNFVKKAVGMAIRRDNASGGLIRICVINKNGREHFMHVEE